jgi:uroporphyrinogen decarboxylase
LKLFREDRAAFEALCNKLSEAIIELLRAQIRAGVDAVQIFDSLGGLLPEENFHAASGVWIREIVAALGDMAPVIVFSKGTRDWISLLNTEANAIGIDHGVSLTEARRRLPNDIAIQGNLDPNCLIAETPAQVSARTAGLLDEMHGRDGHIFNLGHGLPPTARLENIQAVIDTIREDA